MSAEEWYFWNEAESSGPHSKEYIISLIQRGKLSRTVIVSCSNQQNPADQVFNLDLPHQFSSLTESLWAESPSHPWRRLFARILDINLGGMIIWLYLTFLLVAIAPNLLEKIFPLLEGGDGKLLDLMITTFLVIFINAICIGFTGSSIGKFFFGVRVVEPSGEPLGYKKALIREFLIWKNGMGFGIPIVFPFTAIIAYQALKKTDQTKWDKELSLKVEYRRPDRRHYILCIIGFTLIAILIALNFIVE